MSFITPIDGQDAIAEHVAQLTEALSGVRAEPITLTSTLAVGGKPVAVSPTGGNTLAWDATGLYVPTPAAGGTGDVVGPTSATDEAIARFDTTTGKLVQNSPLGPWVNDTGDLIVGTQATARKRMLVSFDTNDPVIQNDPSSGIWMRLRSRQTLSIESGTNLINLWGGMAAATMAQFDTATAPSVTSGIFDNTGLTRRNGMGLLNYAGPVTVAAPGRPGQDEVKYDFSITGAAARTTATVNLSGGGIRILPGDGASASAGAANGGSLFLDGGRGYGTGNHGRVTVGATRGYLTLPHTTAPATPVNGDVWTQTEGLYARINGATVGPYGAGGGFNQATADLRYLQLTGGTLTGDLVVRDTPALPYATLYDGGLTFKTAANVTRLAITSTNGGEISFADGGAYFGIVSEADPSQGLYIDKGLRLYGHLTPDTTNTRDLGTTALRWRRLWGVDADLSGTLTFAADSTATLSRTGAGALRADTHLGVGVNPAAWRADVRAVQVGATASVMGSGASEFLYLSSNSQILTGGQVAQVAGAASQMILTGGNLQFLTAPSVAAGAAQTFTERARIAPTGTLTITPDVGQAHLTSGSGSLILTSAGNIDLWPPSGYTHPHTDNGSNIGHPSIRFSNIYAVTGTINTSSATVKEGITPLDPAACYQAAKDVVWYEFAYLPPAYTEPEPPPEIAYNAADDNETKAEKKARRDEAEAQSKAAHLKMVAETAPARHQRGFVFPDGPQARDDAGGTMPPVPDLFGLPDRQSTTPQADLATLGCALQEVIRRLEALEGAAP